jgi:hypothetical protein
LAKPRSQGPAERAAAVDLRELRRTDGLLPNATAVQVLYRRLARAIDQADAEDAGGRVGFLAAHFTRTHAYLTGVALEPLADVVDPFALAPPLRDTAE